MLNVVEPFVETFLRQFYLCILFILSLSLGKTHPSYARYFKVRPQGGWGKMFLFYKYLKGLIQAHLLCQFLISCPGGKQTNQQIFLKIIL